MTNEELYYLPASELLKHIQAEKERLIKEKVIKKSKPLPPIIKEEKPYDLPAGWEWVKLGQIGYSTIGLTYSPKDVCSSGSTILRSNNVKDGKINLINTVSVNKTIKEDLILKENDILLCSRNGSKALVGKGAIIKDIGIGMSFGAFMTVYRSICNPYINYFIQSNFFRNQLEKCGTTTINQLTQDILLNIIVPLPPLYIQDQIVQKLEQLSETKDSLLFHADYQFNYTKKMREALLQEAIRGELVPQDENDEPASVLLEKIKAEKERLIKEKVIKKQKELSPITEEEKPYDLPIGWEWERLSNVCDVRDGTHDSPKYVEKGYPLVTSKNLTNGKIDFSNVKYIAEKDYLKINARSKVDVGDILLAMIGTIGNPVIVSETDVNFSIKNVALFKFFKNATIDNKYLYYALMNAENEMKYQSAGGVQSFVSLTFLRNYVIPIPPLAEQKRIVDKLDELMANCDQLEAKAEEMKNYTTRLFESSLKEVFMPE